MGEDVDDEEVEEEEEEMDSDLDGIAPTPNRRTLANDSAIMHLFNLGASFSFNSLTMLLICSTRTVVMLTN